MDFKDLREPVEVYQAAAGETEPLARRIESGEELNYWDRIALAAYLRGELVEPKRGRGQNTLPHLARNTKQALKRLRIENAVVLVRAYMRLLRERGEHYGNFEKVLDHVAERDNLSPEEVERVVNSYRRAKTPKENPALAQRKGIVGMYQEWLLRTGRLPDFPQPVGYFERLEILYGWSAALGGDCDDQHEED